MKNYRTALEYCPAERAASSLKRPNYRAGINIWSGWLNASRVGRFAAVGLDNFQCPQSTFAAHVGTFCQLPSRFSQLAKNYC